MKALLEESLNSNHNACFTGGRHGSEDGWLAWQAAWLPFTSNLSLMTISSYVVHSTKETGNINTCNKLKARNKIKIYRGWWQKNLHKVVKGVLFDNI